MQYKRYGEKIVLRLDVGDEIAESICGVAEKERIFAAEVTGIGATDEFLAGVFDRTKGKYDEFNYRGDYEIISLIGNITRFQGKPYVHLHISCADSTGKVVGGHLIKGRISLTSEIVINVISGKIGRKRDDALKINLWEFTEEKSY